MKKSGKVSACGHVVFLLMFSVLLWGTASAQRKTFEKKSVGPGATIKESDVGYQLWEGFLLVRKANAGEPAAQHELGIRYLQGKGFPADTGKAVEWFVKAADQGFGLANYNLGILAMNGWGMPWNPFVSYRYFLQAADLKMPEAQFVVGLILTENLVVAQNWTKAYEYVKSAANAEFEPAKKAMVEFDRRRLVDSVGAEKDEASRKPIFLNFDLDTTTQVDEKALLNELAREAGPELKKTLGILKDTDSASIEDTSAMSLIRRAADAGSPEALCLVGKLRERGIGGRKDAIAASAYYVRAMRLESGRAKELLWNLIQEPGYADELEKRSKGGDPAAQFVWAGLVGARFDQRLSGEQAFALLQSAVQRHYVDALIETGLCYQSGRWTKQDRSRSLELWESAARQGSQEAAIRLSASRLFGNDPSTDYTREVRFMEAEAGEGSLLAQVALGYCYETGRGIPRQKGEAARLYRNAAQRGSQSAYDALRRMHDELRPPGKEFEVGI